MSDKTDGFGSKRKVLCEAEYHEHAYRDGDMSCEQQVREEHYRNAYSTIVSVPSDGAIDIEEAAKKIVDDVLNTTVKSTDDFPFRTLIGQCVELYIRLNGGSVKVAGRVYHVPEGRTNGSKAQLCIDDASLPYDAMVRRESCGNGFVFESMKYDGERSEVAYM